MPARQRPRRSVGALVVLLVALCCGSLPRRARGFQTRPAGTCVHVCVCVCVHTCAKIDGDSTVEPPKLKSMTPIDDWSTPNPHPIKYRMERQLGGAAIEAAQHLALRIVIIRNPLRLDPTTVPDGHGSDGRTSDDDGGDDNCSGAAAAGPRQGGGPGQAPARAGGGGGDP